MVDCVICQKSHFDWQPVSGPLKTLAVLCLCTDGWSSEWHIHTCGEDLCYQSGWFKTVSWMTTAPTYTNCLPHDLSVKSLSGQLPFAFFSLFKGHSHPLQQLLTHNMKSIVLSLPYEKQFHTNVRLFLCRWSDVSTWCGVGVLTYLKPGENLSRRSLLLLQDVPGQSSCVWRGGQSHGTAITGSYTEAKPLPLLSTTYHLRSMEVKTCAHPLTHRVISDSYWFFFFFMRLRRDDAL